MHMVFECELVVQFYAKDVDVGASWTETPDKTKSTSGRFTVLDLLITELLILVRIQYHAQVIAALMYPSQLLLLLLLLLLKEVGSARLRERVYTLPDMHPIISEDPSQTISTYRQEEEKGKNSRKL